VTNGIAPGRFERAMELVFRLEGGFVNDPRDAGGATNLGITQRTLAAWRRQDVTVEDVRKLSREEARAIYRANYWNGIRGDDLPAGVDAMVMQAAVLAGRRQAGIWLQRTLGVAEDGAIGPVTLDAARKKFDAPRLISRFAAYQLGGLRSMRDWVHWGPGWTNRVLQSERFALAMAGVRKA
jgi:lysozyme family protein